MNRHAASVLGLDKLLNLLAGHARTPQGAAAARALEAATTAGLARERLTELSAFHKLVEELGSPPLDGFAEVAGLLDEARTPGACLDVEALLAVRDTVAGAARLIEYLEDAAREGSPIGELSGGQRPLYELEARFERTFGPRGEILDSASPELRRLRAEIRGLREKVLRTLKGVLTDSGFEHVVQDDFITERSNRYVIPLRTDFKGYLKGIVHDHSNTGQTAFVEPLEVVETNNKVNVAREEEEAEIRRILIALTAELGARRADILAQVKVAARVDLLNAKLLLGRAHNGVLPRLDDAPVMSVKGARHPLLALRDDIQVVPVDLRLLPEQRLLLITGANAGGKTVALKTAGLLTLMAHAGMYIPAGDESVVGWFPQVLADIGDEQDIDLDLSTFSAHMDRLREIFETVEPGALVLLDELGTGTDPAQGAALSVALLEELAGDGAMVVATTHLDGLKAFVYGVEWGVNAAVAFDPATGKPLYRLHYGQAGSSNALETAARMGVPGRVLDRARSIAGDGGDSIGAMLARLEARLEEARKREEDAAALTARLEAEAARQKELLEEARAERKSAREEARSEAREMIRRMRAELADLFARVRRGEAAPQEAQQALEKVSEEAARRFPRPEREGGKPLDADALTPGASVYIRSLGKNGTVVNAESSGKVRVRVGALMSTVGAGELFASKASSEAAATKAHAAPAERGARVSVEAERAHPDVVLVGKTVEEALAELDRAVDRAIISGIHRFKVVHGRGTGRLREALRRRVDEDEKLRRAEGQEEDDAITWVEIA